MFFDISKLPGKLRDIADSIDKGQSGNKSNFIDTIKEKSLFEIAAQDAYNKGEITQAEYNSVFNVNKKDDLMTQRYVAPQDNTRVARKEPIFPLQKASLKSANAVSTTDLIKKVAKGSNIDFPYWENLINNLSQQHGLPREIIVAIIAKETGRTFTKNCDGGASGKGPMQITTAAVNAFFPTTKGNWNSYYKTMDNKLLSDTLYTDNSNKRLRYSSPQALRNACAKDDEYGIKVGILTFKMKYIEAIGSMKYSKLAGWKRPEKVLNDMKQGNISLNSAQTKQCVRNAAVNYNGSSKKQQYGDEIMKMLEEMNFDFSQEIVKL